MVTTVVVPPDRLEMRSLEEADELDLVLVSRAIVGRLARFVRDPAETELVNWGAGASTAALDEAAVAAAAGAGLGISGIFTTAPPRDVDLYRSLLPAGLVLPDEPEVGLAAVDFNLGNPVARYQEGWITLRARCTDGREACLVTSMPVTSLTACYSGVAFGFPKYLVDEMTVSDRRVEARYEGEVRFALDFEPSPAVDEAALRARGIYSVESALTVHPSPGGAQLLHWYQRERCGTPGFAGAVVDWEPGLVRPYLRPEDPWAGLVEAGSELPGVRQRVLETGASDLICEKVGPPT